MPTYEYICEKCGHQFDKVQPMSDKALEVCPKELCARKKWGRGKVKRAIGAGGGLLFKGSGFYITDYRSEGYKAQSKKESGGGETKPASGTSDKGAAEKGSSDKGSAPKSESKTPSPSTSSTPAAPPPPSPGGKEKK